MSERAPRCFGYARASTKKQIDSPDTQKENLRKYANLLNLGDVTFFVDAATSGKICWDQRDAGRELFKQLRAGDHVILPKLDRAFRKLSDCVLVLEKFERMGIRLHIVNLMGGAIDLSSSMGRFLIHILAAFAELERAFISERTKDGLAKRKARNIIHTRHPGYGFRWKKVQIDGKWTKVRERDDDERNVMRSIVSWRMQDQPLSWDEIRNHLMYNLKIKTKDGGPWNLERIRRACKAELMLQLQEQRGNR
ncbi:Site-specific DNA recombinase [Singulisphaera sp. GP187]|uniref:recombinase family protein n=1 Tax=Singulisphaera sp. GP187 TaxID=1882752 RepID=UPI000926A8D9|nr:recombinase family protein [Singulisphaera sp. GP187]SIO37066.1 Site-specific DNA recombinase [Singulisphaera sp. GP187]